MDYYGEAINGVLSTFNTPPRLHGSGVDEIIKEMTQLYPIENLNERREMRDRKLALLTKMKIKEKLE